MNGLTARAQRYPCRFLGSGRDTWVTVDSSQNPDDPKACYPPCRSSCSFWPGTASPSTRSSRSSFFECAPLQAERWGTEVSRRKPAKKACKMYREGNMHQILNSFGLSIICTATVNATLTPKAHRMLWRAAWSPASLSSLSLCDFI